MESGVPDKGRCKPGRITRVEAQKKRENRVSIFVEGEFAFGLDRRVYLDNHLHEGDFLTQERIEAVLGDEERMQAREKAVSLLAYRPRSVQELRSRLSDKGFSEKAVQWVVHEFVRLGLLDDRQFALSFARTRMIQKPMGPYLLQRELASHGIAGDLAGEVMDAVYREWPPAETARDLAKRRLPGGDWRALNDIRVKKRVSDYLMRRGFGWDLIQEIFRDSL